MKIAALVGSSRKGSFNKQIAEFMAKRYAGNGKLTIEFVTISDLPLYNQDNELTPPPSVIEAKRIVAECEGVLIVTPEYNHSVPTLLKNALDWFSRVDKVLVGKPVFIVGASPGVLGTARAQMHLRQILNSPGIAALTLPGNEVFINGVSEKLNADGELIHESTVQHLDKLVDNFIGWAKRLKQQ
ncbi:NADPH-dependent FMN reductase [Paenibacillus sp. MCAF20]